MTYTRVWASETHTWHSPTIYSFCSTGHQFKTFIEQKEMTLCHFQYATKPSMYLQVLPLQQGDPTPTFEWWHGEIDTLKILKHIILHLPPSEGVITTLALLRWMHTFLTLPFCDQNPPKLPKPILSKSVKVRFIYLPISTLATRLTSTQ